MVIVKITSLDEVSIMAEEYAEKKIKTIHKEVVQETPWILSVNNDINLRIMDTLKSALKLGYIEGYQDKEDEIALKREDRAKLDNG